MRPDPAPDDQPRIIDGRVYARCPRCGKTVWLNKPIVGSLHRCVLDEDDEDMVGI